MSWAQPVYINDRITKGLTVALVENKVNIKLYLGFFRLTALKISRFLKLKL